MLDVLFKRFSIIYILPTGCIYVFCIDLRTNSECFSIPDWFWWIRRCVYCAVLDESLCSSGPCQFMIRTFRVPGEGSRTTFLDRELEESIFTPWRYRPRWCFIYQSVRRHVVQDIIHFYCGESITSYSLSVYSNEGRYITGIITQLLRLLRSGSSLYISSIHYALPFVSMSASEQKSLVLIAKCLQSATFNLSGSSRLDKASS